MSVIFFATLSAQARLSMYGIASMDSMNSVDNVEEAVVIDAEADEIVDISNNGLTIRLTFKNESLAVNSIPLINARTDRPNNEMEHVKKMHRQTHIEENHFLAISVASHFLHLMS